MQTRTAWQATLKPRRDYKDTTLFDLGSKNTGQSQITLLGRSPVLKKSKIILSNRSLKYMPAVALNMPRLNSEKKTGIVQEILSRVGNYLYNKSIPIKQLSITSPLPLSLHSDEKEGLDLRALIYENGKRCWGGDLVLKDRQSGAESIIKIPVYNAPAVIFRDKNILHGTTPITYLSHTWGRPVFTLQPLSPETMGLQSEDTKAKVASVLSYKDINPHRYITSMYDDTHANVAIRNS